MIISTKKKLTIIKIIYFTIINIDTKMKHTDNRARKGKQ